MHRALRPRERRRHPLERRPYRGGLADRRAAVVGQGSPDAVPRRNRARKTAAVHTVRILVLGANGQVGFELMRALAPIGDVVAATRDGVSPDATRCITADLARADSLASALDEARADVIV